MSVVIVLLRVIEQCGTCRSMEGRKGKLQPKVVADLLRKMI